MRRDGGNGFAAKGEGRRKGGGRGGANGKMRGATRGDYYGDLLQVYDSSVDKIRARARLNINRVLTSP